MKTGLITGGSRGLGKNMALHLAEKGFQPVITYQKAREEAEKLVREIAEATALGRVGLPDDIGGAVAALLDDGARWINGQRIEVAGGVNL